MNRLIIMLVSLTIATGAASARGDGDTFAIQNVQTGKNIRPFEARKTDGNRVIQYPHRSWECMTWQFIQTGENTYKLRNLWTSKTLEPSGNPAARATLWPQPFRADDSQAWMFIKSVSGTFSAETEVCGLHLDEIATCSSESLGDRIFFSYSARIGSRVVLNTTPALRRSDVNSAGDLDPLAIDPAEIVGEKAGDHWPNILGSTYTTKRSMRS